MQTLAQILAGVGGNPYQQTSGLSPMISQNLMDNQMATQQLGGDPAMAAQMGGMPPGVQQPGIMTPQMNPQQPQQGIGSMGATLPQLLYGSGVIG